MKTITLDSNEIYELKSILLFAKIDREYLIKLLFINDSLSSESRNVYISNNISLDKWILRLSGDNIEK